MKVSNVKILPLSPFLNNLKSVNSPAKIVFRGDSFECSNAQNFDKNVLIKRGIISKDKDLFEFFDEISAEIFKDDNAKTFADFLKGGYVSLSTNCYDNLKFPYSAKGVVLDNEKSSIANCVQLEDDISAGIGVGINFTKFKDPIERIKKINSYFKYREAYLSRSPAGIALLNINHPDILDFIALKKFENGQDWCFDLSVVIPSDFLEKVDKNEDIELLNGEKMSALKIYSTLVDCMAKSGEPGVIFSDDKNYLCDSCAAAKLDENENLSLAHVNLSNFYIDNKLDLNLMEKSACILSKAMKNINPEGYIGVFGYQSLLDKMNLTYGEKEANKVLEKCIKTIRAQVLKSDLKMAISPTGGVSRLLKVSPSIEPNNNSGLSYYKEIDTMALAQKYLDGGISKTIILKPNHDANDVDAIIRYCSRKGIKGISVFKPI